VNPLTLTLTRDYIAGTEQADAEAAAQESFHEELKGFQGRVRVTGELDIRTYLSVTTGTLRVVIDAPGERV
jgi:hypothetical protein